MSKIVLVGPVFPLRGGIAHYTALMYRSLSRRHPTDLLSYKLQYPKLLFRKEQRDYSEVAFKVDEAEFGINTVNPLNWMRVSSDIERRKPAAVVIQWWHPYFAPCYRAICARVSAKVVFVCHNVLPHERFPFDRALTKAALECGDAYIVHSKSDEKELLTIIEDAVVRRTELPTYDTFRAHGYSSDEARRKLGIGLDERLILFFGFVRRYKGLRLLLEAMPSVIAALGNVKLVIAGEFDGEKDEYLAIIKRYGLGANIILEDRYLPEREVELYFAAADLVALPYESATQSAVVQIAFGFDRPVVATAVGGLPDAIDDGKTGYLVEPGNADMLSQAIVKFFSEDKKDEFTQNIRKASGRFSWDRMADAIDELIDELEEG